MWEKDMVSLVLLVSYFAKMVFTAQEPASKVLSLLLAGLEHSLGKGELSVSLTSRCCRRFECFLAMR